MKLVKTIVCLVLLFTVGQLQAADTKIEQEPKTALCLVRIESDPTILHLSEVTADFLWNSSLQRAGQGLFGIEVFETNRDNILAKADFALINTSSALAPGDTDPDAKVKPLDLNTITPASNELLYKVEVVTVNPGANAFLTAWTDTLREALNQAYESKHEKYEQQFIAIEEAIAKQEKDIAGYQEELNKTMASGFSNRSELQTKISSLQAEIQNSSLIFKQAQMMIDQNKQDILDVQKAIDSAIANDTVITQFNVLIKDSEESVNLVQMAFQSGQKSSLELNAAKEKLARNRIELAKRQEEVRLNAGQNRLMDLNEQCRKWSRRMTEMDITLADNKQKLSSCLDSLGGINNLELCELRLNASKDNLRDLIARKFALENQLRTMTAPSVTLIGAAK